MKFKRKRPSPEEKILKKQIQAEELLTAEDIICTIVHELSQHEQKHFMSALFEMIRIEKGGMANILLVALEKSKKEMEETCYSESIIKKVTKALDEVREEINIRK